MRDDYGRTIDYMRISITDRCNLRCRYCMPVHVPPGELLTYGEIVQASHAAARAGIRKLKVTGGEPLMRPGCPGLIGMLKAIPGIEQVTMTTNGILLAPLLPELLENGLDAVNISLDTLDRDVYRQITGRDGLAQAMEGIRQALASGIRVKANVVLQRGVNEEEWSALADLTRESRLDVRFIEMMPIGYGSDYEPVPNGELLEKLKEKELGLCEDRRVHGNGPAVYYRMPGAEGSVGFISAVHGKFCGSCNRLRLTSMGQLKPCLCFEDSVDLRKAFRESGREEIDGALDRAFREAVQKKPRQHKFEVFSDITERRQMVQIGG